VADREFKIRITTDADTSGARVTVEELNKVGQSGKKAHEDVAEATGKTEISHRALRVALGQLGPEFAHLGHTALYAFANPATGAVIALALVVGALRKHFEDLSKAAEEAAKRTNDALDNIKTATAAADEEIRKADRSFIDWYKHLNDGSGTVIKNLDSVLAKIKAINGETEEGKKQALEATEKAIREVAGQLPGAEAAATAAHAAAADPNRAARIKAFPAQITAARAAAEAESAKAQGSFFQEGVGILPESIKNQIAAENEAHAREADRLRNQANAKEAELKRLKAEQETKDQEAKDAKQRAADLNAQLTELSAKQETLTGGVASRTATPGLNAPIPGVFLEAIMGATAESRQQGPTQAQQDAERSLAAGMRARGASDQLILELFKFFENSEISNLQKFQEMRQRLANLANRPT